ncbi:MAG: cyanophycin synthetase, partial [Clostridiales bacterium]|nr:cyanophycin synthetase [Clostridiales bacterium]
NSTDADFTATDISYDEFGCGEFTVVQSGVPGAHYKLNIVGKHNISNTLATLALSSLFDIPEKTIQAGLLKYKGTERRFEYKGTYNGATVIDDYAHHPTEIRATLTSAQNYPHRSLYVAFQPHTYSRTKNFLEDFAEALSLADHVILADIYAAREKDPGDISSNDIVERLKKLGTDATYLGDFDSIKKYLKKNLMHDDLLITMGAGNIVEVGEDLVKC